jgi:hypothetical protein
MTSVHEYRRVLWVCGAPPCGAFLSWLMIERFGSTHVATRGEESPTLSFERTGGVLRAFYGRNSNSIYDWQSPPSTRPSPFESQCVTSHVGYVV